MAVVFVPLSVIQRQVQEATSANRFLAKKTAFGSMMSPVAATGSGAPPLQPWKIA
jgi:hypothetical protein